MSGPADRGVEVGCRGSTASSRVGCMHRRLSALSDPDDGADDADRTDDTVDETAADRSELHDQLSSVKCSPCPARSPDADI